MSFKVNCYFKIMATDNLENDTVRTAGTENLESSEVNQSGTVDIEELRREISDKDQKIEELKATVENLKDSFDTALEELALRGKAPEADFDFSEDLTDESNEDSSTEDLDLEEDIKDLELSEEKSEEKRISSRPDASKNVKAFKAVKEEIKAAQLQKSEKTDEIDHKIIEAVKEDLTFRESVLLELEKNELKDQLKEALVKYPEADQKEILLQIEEGVEEDKPNQVELLAKNSHEKRISAKESLRKELEEELKAKFAKELEGDKFVPQSSGSPSVLQSTQPSGGYPYGSRAEDLEWGDALSRAKQVGA